MATMKKGITVASPWWKHLKRAKRVFWKRQRAADKDFIRVEAESAPHLGNANIYRQRFEREP